MIVINSQLAALKQSTRSFQAKVESLEGSTLVDTYNYTDKLIGFDVERVGIEGKFFGFGIEQKATVRLLDKERAVNISTANTLRLRITAVASSTGTLVPWPLFKVSEVRRDENTNELSITAYDVLHQTTKHTIDEVSLTSPYTVQEAAAAISDFLGLTLSVKSDETNWITSYPTGANFDGSETLREVLDDIAEATQTIYFVDRNANLVFLRLSDATTPALTIEKDDYITLESKTSRRLGGIAHVTELGDNVEAHTVQSGTTQYVRDNAFWELRDDIADLVQASLDLVGGLTINQFSCSWRGNFCLEPGDRIDLRLKDGSAATSFIINDKISYEGSLSQETSWSYKEEETEQTNPASIGEVVKQTFARVDKVNREITLVASNTQTSIENLNSDIAAIRLDSESIGASVTSIKESIDTSIDSMNEAISSLNQQVSAQMSAEDVQIQISAALSDSVTNVTTTTGFTFNQDGLTVNKAGSEMATMITEDGMIITKNGTTTLTANNQGVDAVNLHATTYLIVGGRSRFENYGEAENERVGCFWILN